MNKLSKSTFILFAFLISSNIFGQAIDPSLLENLSPEQIELAKSELVKSKFEAEVEPRPVSESTMKIDISEDVYGLKYGYSYFLTTPTSISAVGDLPLPNDYKVSLNDQITIILSGSKEAIFDLSVNLDGTILFPELGSISVAGETFQEVKIKLKNLIDQSFIGVQIDLSLKNLSAKKITIVGAVHTPGTYLVNPFSTITSALGYSGGVSEIGTLRNIRLIRKNGKTFNFDLYKLLINGDRSDDITIESGDVIIIDAANQFIELSGEVRRPAIYEIKNNETLSDLIGFGLGFTQIANKSNIHITSLDNKSSAIKNTVANSLKSDLTNVLSVNVNKYVNKNIPKIIVDGAIREPGLYDIGDSNSLAELINKLEFVDVYPWLAVLLQFDDKSLTKTTTLFSLKDQGTYNSIKLLPNSKIYFADIHTRTFDVDTNTNKLIDEYRLKISHKQGIFELPVVGDFYVQDLIDFLGLDMSDVEDVATYISPLKDLVLQKNYKDMKFSASKYHTLNFRYPINDLIEVSISGALDFPGVYTMTAGSTLQDFYKTIGEFKEDAFLEGIIFSRESIRDKQLKSIELTKENLRKNILLNNKSDKSIDISVIEALSSSIEPNNLGRIAGNFSPNSISAQNTILKNDDSIFVPKTPYFINVLGEVVNPIAFEYSSKLTLNSSIQSAGGFTEFADKRRVYLIKSNGTIYRSKRNIFQGNTKIEAGDTIIVPRRIKIDNSAISSLIPLTQVLSDLSFSAAAIQNLKDNN